MLMNDYNACNIRNMVLRWYDPWPPKNGPSSEGTRSRW